MSDTEMTPWVGRCPDCPHVIDEGSLPFSPLASIKVAVTGETHDGTPANIFTGSTDVGERWVNEGGKVIVTRDAKRAAIRTLRALADDLETWEAS